jgi:hypothetical protein
MAKTRFTETKGHGQNVVHVYQKEDLFTPEERRAEILSALATEDRPMNKGDIRGWTLSHTGMYLSESEFIANARVLMRRGKITVNRTTQEFSLVK